METKRWNEWKGQFHILGVERVAAEFQVAVEGGPPEGVTVKVYENEKGEFWGHPDYEYWGPEQGSPYKSVRPTSSIDKALFEAIQTWMFMKQEHLDNEPTRTFWVYRDPRGPVYIDGNGGVCTEHEAYRRRGLQPPIPHGYTGDDDNGDE